MDHGRSQGLLHREAGIVLRNPTSRQKPVSRNTNNTAWQAVEIQADHVSSVYVQIAPPAAEGAIPLEF